MKLENLNNGGYETPLMQTCAMSVETGFAVSGERGFDDGSISAERTVTNDFLNL